MPEKDKSTIGRSHYTNSIKIWYFKAEGNIMVKNKKFEHFLESFNIETPQQIESIKSLCDPVSFKYILTGHSGLLKTRLMATIKIS